jgi:hypothetical protein
MTDTNNPLGLDGFAFCEFTSPEPEKWRLNSSSSASYPRHGTAGGR